jgi:cold shock CspA family protein
MSTQQLLDVDQKELAGLDQGKKVTFDVAAGKENESAAGVVMYLPNLRLPL